MELPFIIISTTSCQNATIIQDNHKKPSFSVTDLLNLAKPHYMEKSKIERLLMLIMLMSSKDDYTIEDIAERLCITTRSVYRYIDTLRNCGFAIDKKKSNLYKLIELPQSCVNFDQLVYFSEEEANIINFLISSLDNTNSLKITLQKKLCAIYDHANIAELIADKTSADCIEAIGNAIRTKKKVILKDYESAHSKTVCDRLVEPFSFTTNYLDVWAYDLEKQENRIYKIARISAVEILSERWEHEHHHCKSVTDCFRMTGDEAFHIKLELNLRAKNLLIEEYPLAEKDISPIRNKWILDTTVRSLAGVGRFVIGLAKDIKIIESQELRDYIKQYIVENMREYITDN